MSVAVTAKKPTDSMLILLKEGTQLMSIYTPYTYLIGWTTHNKWYYGVRYAKKSKCLHETGCHPDELWITYFTSSEVVKNFISEHGDPDVIQIRRTFSDEDSAIKWEERVLKKMDVIHKLEWLNEGNGKAIRSVHSKNTGKVFWNDGTTTIRSSEYPGDGWVRGLFLTEDQKKERSESRKGKNNHFYGKTHSDEVKEKISRNNIIVQTGRKRSIETRRKISEAQMGKKLTDETKQKLSEINKGKKFTEESKKKMSLSRKGIKKEDSHKEKIKQANKGQKWICPHCNVEGGHGMFRWHFDNCKHKK